jgi:hypothetical protein
LSVWASITGAVFGVAGIIFVSELGGVAVGLFAVAFAFMAVTYIAQAVRDRSEALAGYTTRSNWKVNLDQLDPKTGALIRSGGTPFKSKTSSYVDDDPPFVNAPVATANVEPLLVRKVADDDSDPEPTIRLGPLQMPSGEGVVLAPRPSASKQLTITALIGLGFSAFITVDVGVHFAGVNISGYVLTFLASLAGLVLVWLVLLGGRTLDRRRLQKKFPGTLVFSFGRSADLTAGLRRLNLIDPMNDFDIGTVQAVVDLHGITLWQGNPPRPFAGISWASIQSLRVAEAFAPNSTRRSTIINVDVSESGLIAQLPLFGVNASPLPFAQSGEVNWVERQLERLLAQSSETA